MCQSTKFRQPIVNWHRLAVFSIGSSDGQFSCVRKKDWRQWSTSTAGFMASSQGVVLADDQPAVEVWLSGAVSGFVQFSITCQPDRNTSDPLHVPDILGGDTGRPCHRSRAIRPNRCFRAASCSVHCQYDAGGARPDRLIIVSPSDIFARMP